MEDEEPILLLPKGESPSSDGFTFASKDFCRVGTKTHEEHTTPSFRCQIFLDMQLPSSYIQPIINQVCFDRQEE
jgi:hypothetical protein